MSLLKTIDPATGQLNDPPVTDPRAAFREAMQRVEDAFTVALKGAEDRAAAAESSLATLKKEHDALQKKAALLDELKAKLQGA